MRAFRKGLSEAGYVEGQNVAIEYRWAEGQVRSAAGAGGRSGPPAGRRDRHRREPRLPHSRPRRRPRRFRSSSPSAATRSDLGSSPASTGRAATSPGSISSPSSWRQSGWNCCVSWCPRLPRVAVLVNPQLCADRSQLQRRAGRGRRSGCKFEIFNASTEREIDAAFANIRARAGRRTARQHRPILFNRRRDQIVTLAARHANPAIYRMREFAEAGGLMSYGASITDAYRQVGVYTGRILKGAKPADLPVVQPTKFELVINLKTAKALGLDRAADRCSPAPTR